ERGSSRGVSRWCGTPQPDLSTSGAGTPGALAACYHSRVGQGCLTDEQLARLRDGAPGTAAPELAQHPASCESCQSRALFGAKRQPGAKREPPKLPSLGRALLLIAIVVLAMAAFLWSLGRLAGSGAR